MHIVGTAGHVDHGKSALVWALTGTNPDRWLEERVRGMTLDLGFARLHFDDGTEAGIVDVPGHERFLHNMLAGAAGMELLLLVVAANEGPRPQTLEHLAILRYLNVRRSIVVLTKIDLVDPADLAVAEAMTREGLKGTLAASAPMFRVSTVTGAGLAELRAAIHAELRALAPRDHDAPAYLPIDRVFALAGHGTVVTGTLMQGRISTGDRLRLTPLSRDVRVRSLQTFGERREYVEGGARVAANLPGVDVAEIARGAVLASPQLETSAELVVRFTPLVDALAMLRRRTPVRAYIGSAEILGTLVFSQVPTASEEVRAVLRLRAPTVVVPGSAFVVRRLSPKDVIGGGKIEGIARGAPALESEAREDQRESSPLVAALRAAGLAGAGAEHLGAAANVRVDVAEAALADLVADGRAVRLAKPSAYLDGALADQLFARVGEALAASERATPWLFGMTSLGLSRVLEIPEPVLVRILAVFADDGRVAQRAGYFATPAFVPQLSDAQRAFFDGAFAVDDDASNVPVALDALLAAMRTARVVGLNQSFDMLLASGALIKVGDAVYRRSQLDRIRGALATNLRGGRQMTMAEFRDLVGTSRKYAVPLLEWFDASGLTIRNGDVRVLRSVPQR